MRLRASLTKIIAPSPPSNNALGPNASPSSTDSDTARRGVAKARQSGRAERGFGNFNVDAILNLLHGLVFPPVVGKDESEGGNRGGGVLGEGSILSHSANGQSGSIEKKAALPSSAPKPSRLAVHFAPVDDDKDEENTTHITTSLKPKRRGSVGGGSALSPLVNDKSGPINKLTLPSTPTQAITTSSAPKPSRLAVHFASVDDDKDRENITHQTHAATYKIPPKIPITPNPTRVVAPMWSQEQLEKLLEEEIALPDAEIKSEYLEMVLQVSLLTCSLSLSLCRALGFSYISITRFLL